jgi:hypothetical protein
MMNCWKIYENIRKKKKWLSLVVHNNVELKFCNTPNIYFKWLRHCVFISKVSQWNYHHLCTYEILKKMNEFILEIMVSLVILVAWSFLGICIIKSILHLNCIFNMNYNKSFFFVQFQINRMIIKSAIHYNKESKFLS